MSFTPPPDVVARDVYNTIMANTPGAPAFEALTPDDMAAIAPLLEGAVRATRLIVGKKYIPTDL